MDEHAMTDNSSRQATNDCGENELRHINRGQGKREQIGYSVPERESILAASPIVCSPSSLVNLLRSHHTDNNSTNRTTDDGFVPLADLVRLWKILSLIYWVNVQCRDICFYIVHLKYLLKDTCAHRHASTPLTSTCAYTHIYTHTHTHTCVNPRTSLAWWTERRKSPFTGVWFCLKSLALFIVIKVPLTIPPVLKSPQPYIILISTESRERWEKEGLKFLQSIGVKTGEERVQSVLRLSRKKGCLVVLSGFPDLTGCKWRSQSVPSWSVHTPQYRWQESQTTPGPLTKPGWLSLTL